MDIMFKLISLAIKLLLLIIIVSVIFPNISIKYFLTGLLRVSLGTAVYIDDVRVDIINSQFKVTGLEIWNPRGFPDGILTKIPKIFVDIEFARLLDGRLYFDTFEIDCRDIRVIRNEDGKINWMELKIFRQKSGVREDARQKPGRTKFYVENLVLSLGYATYTDLYVQPPVQKSHHLRVENAVFRDIESAGDIVKIVTWEVMKRMGIGKLIGNIPGLENSAGGFFDGLVNSIKGKF